MRDLPRGCIDRNGDVLAGVGDVAIGSAKRSESVGIVDVCLDPDAVVVVGAAIRIEPDPLIDGNDAEGIAVGRTQVSRNPLERVPGFLLDDRIIELRR